MIRESKESKRQRVKDTSVVANSTDDDICLQQRACDRGATTA
jgi:hypothetical protein